MRAGGALLVFALAAGGCGSRSATVPTTPTPRPTTPLTPASMANPAWDAEFPVRGRTYHVAPTGNDAAAGTSAAPFATIQHAADVVRAGDGVLVHAGTYREKVDISAVGRADAYIVFKAEGDVVVTDPSDATWSWNWDGLFTLDRAAYVVVSGFNVRDSHWFGLSAKGSRSIYFQNNVTDHTGASGIFVRDSQDVVVRGNTVRRACYQRASVVGKGFAQECLSMASVEGFDVHHNEVFESAAPSGDDAGGEGIDAKESCRRGRVHDNHVHDLQRLGIYVDSWSGLLEDVEVFANVVHDCATGYAVSSENGGTVRGVRIYNNLAYRNRFSGIEISTWGEPGTADGPREDVVIVNNTSVGNGTSGWGGGIAITSRNVRGIVVRNNLLSGNPTWQIAAADPSRVQVDRNLIDPFRGTEASEVRGESALEGDPRFVDVARGDLHLAAGSPAIDAGARADAPDVDLDGVPRPRGSGVDIGAYERP